MSLAKVEVSFGGFPETEGSEYLYVVIMAKYHGRWVFCKHRERTTLECPGGHVEPGETVSQAAKRELYEETGALEFELEPIVSYSVSVEPGPVKTYGMLFYAEIAEIGPMPQMEIERIELWDGLPEQWTYPQIQPKLLEYTENWMTERKLHGNKEK